jgi:hypothetical protein
LYEPKAAKNNTSKPVWSFMAIRYLQSTELSQVGGVVVEESNEKERDSRTRAAKLEGFRIGKDLRSGHLISLSYDCISTFKHRKLHYKHTIWSSSPFLLH